MPRLASARLRRDGMKTTLDLCRMAKTGSIFAKCDVMFHFNLITSVAAANKKGDQWFFQPPHRFGQAFGRISDNGLIKRIERACCDKHVIAAEFVMRRHNNEIK